MEPAGAAARRAARRARRADARHAAGRDRAHLAARPARRCVLITNDVDEAHPARRPDRPARRRARPRRSGRRSRVDIARPRDRKALNHDPRFKRIRSAGHRVPARRSAAQRPREPKPRRGSPPDDREAALTHERQLPRDLASSTRPIPTPSGPAVIVEDFDLDARRGRVRLPDRPLRLRQVHGAVDGRRPARRRPRGDDRAGRQARSTGPAPTAASSSSRRACCPG